ncbi:unnamed protein product [Chondrus crispus]|uniref:Uncharacterized protein n=1 Tax=Chondrus crispus TaxID=2769 RepID=R7Q681_CHOCR|nr:unnamed protein product [Chondrus crispus]CDF32901.1 unnamed protein product [Chondrus crispus]|eukprot:XP_005712702.1 unnamed protein product [Chondrus crispus]
MFAKIVYGLLMCASQSASTSVPILYLISYTVIQADVDGKKMVTVIIALLFALPHLSAYSVAWRGFTCACEEGMHVCYPQVHGGLSTS